MKCQIPQISWHSRDPVLSIDFQSYQNDFYRLASGGTDSHVLIWFVTFNENKTINIECASDLYRHQKSVNVVRFSPSGEILASGDDEGAIFLWKLKDRDQLELPNDEDNTNKEDWYPIKLLRGHLEDVYDISWSKDGNFLVSASMDNTAIMWDAQLFQKIHIFSDFKGYVQGIAWDPLNQYIASLGSDRALRIHNVNSKKLTFKVQKAPWTVSTDKGSNKARLFYDDTLQSYCRRLTFTPDGELLFAPSGIYEKDEMRKFRNATYVFSRHCLNKPALHLPSGDKYTIAVRCNPLLFELRSTKDVGDKENEPNLKSKLMIDLPYRMIIAVATCDSLLMYDTQQLLPFAFISNIHYTHLTDLSWSADGRILVASSTDGYCSFVVFNEEELGKVYVPKTPPKKETKVQPVNETVKDVDIKNDVLTKTPNVIEKSNAIDGLNSFTKVKVKGSTADEKNVKNSKSEKVIKSSPTTTKLAVTKIVKEASENLSSPKTVKKNENIRSIKSFFTLPTQKIEQKKKGHDEIDDDVLIENPSEKFEKPTVPHIAVTSPNTPAGIDKNVKLESVDVNNSPVKLDITCEDAMDCETAYSKVSSSDSPQNSSKPKCKGQLEGPIPDVEAMDVSDNCKEALATESSSKSSSKFNIKLDFGSLAKDKESESVKSLESVDQEVSKPKSDVSSETNGDNVPKTTEEASNVPNADDWKLELTCDGDTQADEIAAPSTSNVKKSPAAKMTDVATDKNVTPKRRVQFVTLSSNTTLK